MSRSRTSDIKDRTNGVALTQHGCLFQQVLLPLFFLQLDTSLSLEPALSRFILVGVLVFLKLRKELSDATNVRSLSLLRCVVRGRHPNPIQLVDGHSIIKRSSNHRSGGLGAKRASKLGGSLSVMACSSSRPLVMKLQLRQLVVAENLARRKDSKGIT